MDSLYVLFQLIQQVVSFSTVVAYVILFNRQIEMILSDMVFKLNFSSCYVVTVFVGTFLVLSFSLAKAACPMAALLMDGCKSSATHFANVLQLTSLLKLTLLLVDCHLGLSQGKCLVTHRAHPLLFL